MEIYVDEWVSGTSGPWFSTKPINLSLFNFRIQRRRGWTVISYSKGRHMWSCVWVVLPGVLRSGVLRQAPADRGLSTHRSPTGLPSPNWPVDPNMAIRSPFLLWLISYGRSRKLKRYFYPGFEVSFLSMEEFGMGYQRIFDLVRFNIKAWLREPCVSGYEFTGRSALRWWALYSTYLFVWVRVCVRVRARGLRPAGEIPWAQGLRSATVCMAEQPTLTPSDLPPDIEIIGAHPGLDSTGIRHWPNQFLNCLAWSVPPVPWLK